MRVPCPGSRSAHSTGTSYLLSAQVPWLVQERMTCNRQRKALLFCFVLCKRVCVSYKLCISIIIIMSTFLPHLKLNCTHALIHVYSAQHIVHVAKQSTSYHKSHMCEARVPAVDRHFAHSRGTRRRTDSVSLTAGVSATLTLEHETQPVSTRVEWKHTE